jgi:hypothetical protein
MSVFGSAYTRQLLTLGLQSLGARDTKWQPNTNYRSRSAACRNPNTDMVERPA